MGWDFGWASRDDVVAYILRQENVEVMNKHLSFGDSFLHDPDVLWTVERYTNPRTGEVKVMIGCYLLSFDHGTWGYKAMCESMGPFYYSCPLQFLERTDVEGVNAKWRDNVRAWHAAKQEAAHGC